MSLECFDTKSMFFCHHISRNEQFGGPRLVAKGRGFWWDDSSVKFPKVEHNTWKSAIPKKKLSSSCGTITFLQSRTARFRGCILHSTWDLQATYYCWWKKSYTGWYGEYHMFHDRWCRISFINSSTDFLPESTRILPQRSGEVSIVKRKMVVSTSVAKFHHVYLSPGKIFSPKCSYVEPKASATPPSPSHCFWHFAGHGTAKQFWLHSVQVPYLELSPGRSPLRFHIIKTSGILKLLAFIKKI